MVDLLGLLRSHPVMTGGSLAHKDLKNTLLLPSEGAAAGRLTERPRILDEMTDMLREIEDTFTDGYDPGAFILELPSLRALDEGLRNRLLIAVRRQYLERFCPEMRLDDLRRSGSDFLKALRAWHRQVNTAGVNDASAALWERLQDRAAALRELLEDSELSMRWIP